MKKLNRFTCLLFLIALAASQVCPAAASANEVWVTPAVLNPSKVVGNWALTGTGYTRFSFVVPDNFTGLPEAKVVVLGQCSDPVTISYNLSLSVSGDGIDQAQQTYNQVGGNANIAPNVFTEIDVTPILPTNIPLNPGDYVSLFFNTTVNTLSANIMGLRFIYAAQGIPRGAIMMWSGTIAPSGWALCDGQNGTPDLRDRFVLGAGNIYPIGQAAGEATHTLTIGEMPAHAHGTIPTWLGISGSNRTVKLDITYGEGNLAGTSWSNVSIPAAGGGVPHNNMPPYYALCFIMKL